MRFMMLMYPERFAEEGVMPSAELMSEMMKYNEELGNAGVLLSLDGLKPSSNGFRVTYPNGKATITDGPFTESKEILGGFWIINVASIDEAKAWAQKIPGNGTNFVEVRPFFEMTDFPQEVRDEAAEERVAAKLGASQV